VAPYVITSRVKPALRKCASWIDQRSYNIIGTTPRARVGAVIVDIHRTARHGVEGDSVRVQRNLRRITAVGRVEELGCNTGFIRQDGGRVVGHRDIEGIAGIHVQGRVLQAARRHEAKQLPVERIGGCLIREADVQNEIFLRGQQPNQRPTPLPLKIRVDTS
jgi:hypothetical protein